MMKKTLKVMAMLFFVVSMTTLTSCKKENANLIIGKWECVTASYTENDVTQQLPYLNGMVWEFKTNGIVNGYDLFDISDDEEIGASATYVVSDNILTIKYTDFEGNVETETYNIKELTKSKLVLEERDKDDLLVVEFKKI